MFICKKIFTISAIFFSLRGFSQGVGLVEINPQLNLREKWGQLSEAIKHKKIVALGENLHGVKEYNSTKLELIKYLHEVLGFNVLAIESDVAKNYYGNLNKSAISDTTFLKELFTPPWHTEEYLELVKYVKSQPNLSIIGFDVETKSSVEKLEASLKIEIDTATKNYLQFNKNYVQWREVNGNFPVTTSQRDSTMADVLKWIIHELYPNEKIIISGHNNHISNKPIAGACMGELLKKEYGENYYSIGFFHSLGNPKHVLRKVTYENEASQLPETSIQSKFLEIEKSMVFINIDPKNKLKKYKWIYETLDNVLLVGKYKTTINLSDSFDGIIWIKTVTHPKYVIRNKYLEK